MKLNNLDKIAFYINISYYVYIMIAFSIVELKYELPGAREMVHRVKSLACKYKDSCLDFGSLPVILRLGDKHRIYWKKLVN